MSKPAPYVVEIVTCVDHPELRAESYRVRSGPVYYTTLRVECWTLGAALRLREDLVRGDLDFASEYVNRVSIKRTSDGRLARRDVRRERPGLAAQAA